MVANVESVALPTWYYASVMQTYTLTRNVTADHYMLLPTSLMSSILTLCTISYLDDKYGFLGRRQWSLEGNALGGVSRYQRYVSLSFPISIHSYCRRNSFNMRSPL